MFNINKDQRPDMGAGEAFIKAENLSMWAPFGQPYTNVSISVPRGTLLAVSGKHGSGKTPFLLTLAGRMVSTKGTLTVDGYSLPKQRNKVMRKAGMGIFKGLNDLEENLPAMSIVRAEMDVYDQPNDKQFVRDYLERYGLGHVGSTHIRDYHQVDLIRLGIALGMVGNPDLLVVDDIEDQMTLAESIEIIDQLRGIAHDNNIVVAYSCTEPAFAEEADMVCDLSAFAEAAAKKEVR